MASDNRVASSTQSPMASGGGGAQSHPPAGSSTEYQLRKYLLLLATLVATVTYVAGLNLPGGAWQEDTDDGRHHAGDPILQYAHLHRYLTFYYCNATAFAASLVVSLLLLVLDGKNTGWWEALLLVVMVLDLLGLMGAYAAGSCRDKFTTIYSALLVCAVFAYVVVAFTIYLFSRYGGWKQGDVHHVTGSADADATDTDTSERQELHEVLMLLATFAVTITYVAGLNPPGGFWSDTEDGHQMSDPVLMEHYSSRYQAFYVCNTTAFVASLLIIILLLDKKLTTKLSVRSVALYGLTITALLGLVGAYAAGSCRQLDDTTYVICLIAGVLAYIFLQVAVAGLKDRCSCFQTVCDYASKCLGALRSYCDFDRSQGQKKPDQAQIRSRGIQVTGDDTPQNQDQGSREEAVEKARSLVMLLATLVVSITYSAGLDPPALEVVFFWVKPYLKDHWNQWWNHQEHGHKINTQDHQQESQTQQGQQDQQRLSVDGSGSSEQRNKRLQEERERNKRLLEAKKQRNMREYLMLLGVLAASVTYQTGLKPPGGLWQEDNSDGDHSAGSSILHYINKGRYNAFFYCNSTSFMASVVVIILLLHDLSRRLWPQEHAPRDKNGLTSHSEKQEKDHQLPLWPMHTAIFFDMLGLLGAYAAGSTRDWQTSKNVIYLVIPVLAYIAAYAAIKAVSSFRARKDGVCFKKKKRWQCQSQEQQV